MQMVSTGFFLISQEVPHKMRALTAKRWPTHTDRPIANADEPFRSWRLWSQVANTVKTSWKVMKSSTARALPTDTLALTCIENTKTTKDLKFSWDWRTCKYFRSALWGPTRDWYFLSTGPWFDQLWNLCSSHLEHWSLKLKARWGIPSLSFMPAYTMHIHEKQHSEIIQWASGLQLLL